MFSENQFGMERQSDVPESTEPEKWERRRHVRYPVEGEAEVLIADGSQIFRGRIVDISLSGCFIETRARLGMAVGMPAEMVFRANGVMLRTVATLCAVRTGAGAGFVFETLSERMRAELQSLIELLEGSASKG